jgi:uncharacterized RDD family membrane protein YckC
MRTLDEFRVRYARYADEDLLTLLASNPEALTPEARQALAEVSARRGGQTSLKARTAVRAAIIDAELRPKGLHPTCVYAKARLGARFGAYVTDRIIGMGPWILAAVFGWIFPVAPPNSAVGFLNILGTFAWAVYYGLTKDGRPNGQSIGKGMFGLMVVNVKTNQPCSRGESATRAFIGGLVGIVPLVGWLIEPAVATVRDDGRRLGDQAADTQVIAATTYEGTELEAD